MGILQEFEIIPIHTIQHMRSQGYAFNIETIVTINIPWDMSIQTADRSDHTLVLHQEVQSFVCLGQCCSRRSQYLAGLFAHSMYLGQYIRESIFFGCSWGCILTYMVHFTTPGREAYCHLLDINFTQWLPPQDVSCCHWLLPVLFAFKSIFMRISFKRGSEDVLVISFYFQRVKKKTTASPFSLSGQLWVKWSH